MADRKLGKNVSDLDNNVVEIRGVGKGKAETSPDYWQLTLPESNTQDPADLWQWTSAMKHCFVVFATKIEEYCYKKWFTYTPYITW